MPAEGFQRGKYVLFMLALPGILDVHRVQSCRIGSGPECEKASFVPGYNLAGEGFDVVRMRRTGAYVINVKAHLVDNHTCTLCANPFRMGQVSTVKLSTLLYRVSSFSLNLLQLLPSNCFPLFVPSAPSFLHHTSCKYFLLASAYHCTSCLFSPPQIQKLPAAVLDWRPFSRCSKQLSSALHHSVDSLLRSSSSLVNNNWDLGLSLDNIGKAVMGGSRSDLAKFARSQHSVDKATFAIHEISCTYYR